MISIKDVYSTILYAANKEQRGYIGPDEFNRYAELSQIEIFEGYFSDLAHFAVSPKGVVTNAGYGELTRNIMMKIEQFSSATDITKVDNVFSLPDDFYRLDTVSYRPSGKYITLNEAEHKNINRILQAPLTAPTETFPVYVFHGGHLEVYPSSIEENIHIDYIRLPKTPEWRYNEAVKNATDGQEFYDPSLSVDFELHESEIYVLIQKILMYVGLSIKEADVVQFAQAATAEDEQMKRS